MAVMMIIYDNDEIMSASCRFQPRLEDWTVSVPRFHLTANSAYSAQHAQHAQQGHGETAQALTSNVAGPSAVCGIVHETQTKDIRRMLIMPIHLQGRADGN